MKTLSIMAMLLLQFVGTKHEPQLNSNLLETNSSGVSNGHSQYNNSITYNWVHGHNNYNVEFTFALHFNRGLEYMQSVYTRRHHNHGNYADRLITDPFFMDYGVLADQLYDRAIFYGLDPASVALSFVQSLPYDDKNHHYQRDGIETAIDRRGDCSDKSVLLAGILRSMGRGVVFINTPGHLAIGVTNGYYTNYSGTYYTYGGVDYFWCETTSDGEIGETNVQSGATIYPSY